MLWISLLASPAFAYNANHRPFSDDAQPERILLVDIPRATAPDGSTDENSQSHFISTNGPQITCDDKLCYVDFSIDGQAILARVPFSSFAEWGGQFEVSTADLNRDGIPDYVLAHWLWGVRSGERVLRSGLPALLGRHLSAHFNLCPVAQRGRLHPDRRQALHPPHLVPRGGRMHRWQEPWLLGV